MAPEHKSKKEKTDKTIFVYLDLSGDTLQQPALMGTLHINAGRSNEVISFEYDKRWIYSQDQCFAIDPDLMLFEGRQYAPPGKTLFGVFSDSCPDRWGRLLMNRKEAILARKQGRKPRALAESDYLLGVLDETRMGALRFSYAEGGPFESGAQDLAVPPWASLRSLEAASLAFEGSIGGDEDKWLDLLLAPGSSLGGARPKASVQAPDGSLWIAKFPSRHDEWDSGAWEIIVRDLAVLCGLRAPEAQLSSFTDAGGTYLAKRFDRDGSRRIHFASAMALLDKTDGAGSEGASYLDIAAFIKSNGTSPKRDLLELWKRIVFYIAVSNTDDHLRNHGFLLTDQGWELSPLYDVNPNIYGDALSLNINTTDSSIKFELALETAGFFCVDSQIANDSVKHIIQTVESHWRPLAVHYGLNQNAISQMAPAFEMKFK